MNNTSPEGLTPNTDINHELTAPAVDGLLPPAEAAEIKATDAEAVEAVQEPVEVSERGSWAGSVREGLGRVGSKAATGFVRVARRAGESTARGLDRAAANIEFGVGVAVAGTAMAASIFGRGARGAGRGISRGARATARGARDAAERAYEHVADPDAELRREERAGRKQADRTLPADMRVAGPEVRRNPRGGRREFVYDDDLTAATGLTRRVPDAPVRRRQLPVNDPSTGLSIRSRVIQGVSSRRDPGTGNIQTRIPNAQRVQRTEGFGPASYASKLVGVRIDSATGRPARIRIPDPADALHPPHRPQRTIEVEEHTRRGLQWNMPKELSARIDEGISDMVTAEINGSPLDEAQARTEAAVQRVIDRYWPDEATNPAHQQQVNEFVGYIEQEIERRRQNAEAVRNRFGF